MDKLKILGKANLTGSIEVSGAKNSALPIMICSLLSKHKLKLKNIPNLVDINTMKLMLESFGIQFTINSSSMTLLGAAMSGISEGADGFARFIASITSLQGLDLTGVSAALSDIGWSILGFSFVISFMDDDALEKLITVGTSMKDLFGSIGSVDLSGMATAFESLTLLHRMNL